MEISGHLDVGPVGSMQEFICADWMAGQPKRPSINQRQFHLNFFKIEQGMSWHQFS